MSEVICQLGNARELCLAELRALVGDGQVTALTRDTALVTLPDEVTPSTLMSITGGVVKIAVPQRQLPLTTSETLILDELEALLAATESRKLQFCVGELGRDHLPALNLSDLKNRLQARGLKVRFRQTPRSGAGAALLLHRQRVTELLVIQTQDAIHLAQTVAVQDIDDWTRRDRGRPYADHKKGMLPPKVARMMVNLAGGERVLTGRPVDVYDPFCGTGTILMEAAFYGGTLSGSDLDPKAAAGTRANLEWLANEYRLTNQLNIFTRGVTDSRPQDFVAPVRFLVSEPFLGKQTPKERDLPGMFRGLEKMYWGAFRHWRGILAAGSSVVIVFPRVTTPSGRDYTLDSLLDKLAEIGYNKRASGLIYARPGAIVQRDICVFDYVPVAAKKVK